jgi:F0F1-type ATP synthase membrane subunit b/b'
MSERDSFIETIKLETVDAAKELEHLTDELKERESAVRTKAMEVRHELEAGGSQEATEIFASTNKEIETIKENAENEINAQILEARKHLQKESETLVVNIMESLLNRRLAP